MVVTEVLPLRAGKAGEWGVLIIQWHLNSLFPAINQHRVMPIKPRGNGRKNLEGCCGLASPALLAKFSKRESGLSKGFFI